MRSDDKGDDKVNKVYRFRNSDIQGSTFDVYRL